MKLDFNKKSHKLILLLLLAVPIFTIGFIITFFSQTQAAPEPEKTKTENVEVEEESAQVDPSPSEKKEEQETELVIKISEEDKAASKVIAEKFAQAYSNYDAEKPTEFIQNAKPYMTEGLYKEWEEEAPRKPLALVKSTVKSVETFPVDGGDQYTIVWNVIVQQEQLNPLGDLVPVEDWFWIAVVKDKGEWKVKGVDITNG